MDILYISPHYDDAIISCGGKIYSDVKEGHNVSVVTIFSEVKGPFSDYAKSLHSYWKLTDPFLERRNENINACKILGVENITLGLEDAIYRTFNSKFLYPNNGDIFRKINLHDKNIKNKIVDKIKKIATIFRKISKNVLFSSIYLLLSFRLTYQKQWHLLLR